MRNTLVVTGLAFVAVVGGVYLLLYGPGGLASSPSPALTTSELPPVAVPFKEIARGTKSTVKTRVNYLITSVDELKKLWKMVDATSTPPTIDFTSHALMAVFAGQQPATGYAIAVAKVQDAAARIVSITIARPDKTCAVKHATTTPYTLIEVPITSLPLTHEDTSTTIGCP